MDTYELMIMREEGHSTTGASLSAYEKDVFDTRLSKAQACTANDTATDSLRYLFGIFN